MSGRLSIDERDAHLIRQAKAQSMGEADRKTLWSKTYRQSSERQKVFLAENAYCGFMEGCFHGLIRADENRGIKPSGRDRRSENDDVAALDLAKAKGLTESERREMWSSSWHKSPNLQREFLKDEHYVAWAEYKYRSMK